MPELWIIILIHQILFQGMFITKNIVLGKKIKKQICGNNFEAKISIIYFSSLIIIAFIFSFYNISFGRLILPGESIVTVAGLTLVILSLVISAASLINLGDSWRIGVIEDQKTEFVTSGICRYTRNPYFLSYLLMFAAYTILLQNIILLGPSIIAIFFVHNMILKEEKYLMSIHADAFTQYKNKVARYIII